MQEVMVYQWHYVTGISKGHKRVPFAYEPEAVKIVYLTAPFFCDGFSLLAVATLHTNLNSVPP